MRSIKFRAWDKGNKTMVPVDQIRFSLNGEISGIKWTVSEIEDRVVLKENLILMQFTGKKDSEGKEIYEEDVVDVLLADSRQVKGVIKFIDGCFDIDFMAIIRRYGQDRDYLKCYTVNHAVKIMGNIYENEDLLKRR